MTTLNRVSYLVFLVGTQVYFGMMFQASLLTFPASYALKLKCNPVMSDSGGIEIGGKSFQQYPKDDSVYTPQPGSYPEDDLPTTTMRPDSYPEDDLPTTTMRPDSYPEDDLPTTTMRPDSYPEDDLPTTTMRPDSYPEDDLPTTTMRPDSYPEDDSPTTMRPDSYPEDDSPTTTMRPDSYPEDDSPTTTMRPDSYPEDDSPTTTMRPDSYPEDDMTTLTPPDRFPDDISSAASQLDVNLAAEIEESIGETDRQVRSLYDYDFIDYLTHDVGATDFYKPSQVAGEAILIRNKTKTYAENRKPFVQEVGFSVSDKVPLESVRGYVQDHCECYASNCEQGFSDPLSDKYWFIRHQELCFRKGRNITEHQRNIKRLQQDCDWSNACTERYFTQPLCSNAVTKLSLTTAEKYGLLFFHNLLRARRAEGSNVGSVKGRRREVPAMMEMEWDANLADKAQRLVNSCEYGNDCSYCRNTDFVGNVGQVFINVIANHTVELDVLLRRMLEVARLHRTDTESFKGAGGSGLLGQMLWEGTQRVGCGLLRHELQDDQHTYQASAKDGGEGSDQEYWETLLACNYYPAGNEVGRPVMSFGPACSNCPSRTQCSTYSKVLCSRFYTRDMHDMHPEEAEQFFALTEEEKELRVKIIDVIFESAENKHDHL